MVEQTAFRGIIEFLGELGVYDVILPFLLVFTIVFAIFEKTKILGTEKIGDQVITKKNLNSIVALIIAFLVVASTKLVSVINEVMANVVLLLILAICFLLLVGVFFGDKEFTLKEHSGWTNFFMIAMFIGIVIIFLNALDWMQYIFALFIFWDAQWAVGAIFLIVIVLFLWFITKDATPVSKKEEKKE